MKIKNLLSTVSIIAILATPGSVMAQTITPTQSANQSQKLINLHTQADSAIAQRLNSLNSAMTRINSLVKLSTDQKNTYINEINTDINGLSSLKTKCDSDTDLATLRSDYKTIFTTYRIYAEFLPQTNLLVASDTMDVTADKLSDLATKLQSRIQTLGNPSNLTSLLTDMQAKISDAKTQYTNVQSQITPLTPQDYDNNPSGTTATIKTARSNIKTGAADLKTAFQDAEQIRAGLKGTSTSITPAPTLTQ